MMNVGREIMIFQTFSVGKVRMAYLAVVMHYPKSPSCRCGIVLYQLARAGEFSRTLYTEVVIIVGAEVTSLRLGGSEPDVALRAEEMICLAMIC